MISEERKDNAIFHAGQMVGFALRLDEQALEEALKDKDFRYVETCRLCIAFKRNVMNNDQVTL